MQIVQRHFLRRAFIFTWLTAALRLTAQVETIGPHLGRSAGVDAASGISYVRLYLNGMDAPDASGFELMRPTLTAQCTKHADGKLLFELFANFGNVTDATFYPPWKPGSGDLFPPRTTKAKYTMEFLGYRKMSPVKREFEHVMAPKGQLRYNPPGGGSGNMEPIAYFLQYLKALPTLRLSGEGHSASWLATPLLNQLHNEPLCVASGA
jgi:hypothetical protein